MTIHVKKEDNKHNNNNDFIPLNFNILSLLYLLFSLYN